MSRDPRESNSEYATTLSYANGLIEKLQDDVKRLTADKARLTIDMYADANNYQVQAVEIGELRKRAEKAEGELTRWKEEVLTQGRSYLEKQSRAYAAEEREQKLKEAVEEALKWTWYHGEANMKEIEEGLQEAMETLYPLEREDTK